MLVRFYIVISTHAPAGGATRGTRAMAQHSTNFYSRPCGRGDQIRVFMIVDRGQISTHAPAGGATKVGDIAITARTISTHAPAGGATRDGRPQSAARQSISTHAPAGGATESSDSKIVAKKIFLLTPLREGRPNDIERILALCEISTHAPAGGATIIVLMRQLLLLHFYSRPCGRGDARREKKSLPSGRFLLTPLREGRR